MIAIRDLVVQTPTSGGTATILRGVNLDIADGQILGVVGESGSGKSTLAGAIMGMLPGGMTARGSIVLDGTDLLALSPSALAALRGTRLAMIFQDPMTALNPLFTIGTLLGDVLARRRPALSRAERRARCTAMLARVGLPDPAACLVSYPHTLSGGMRQRVLIAMALLTEPGLLIADEPTTALDATVEAQIAALFAGLRTELAGGVLFISHHLGLVAQLCDAVAVLYGGTLVESGPVDAVLGAPLHPYTQALLACEIEGDAKPGHHLAVIPGTVPDPVAPQDGCIFASRCPQVIAECRVTTPSLTVKRAGHRAACIRVPDA